MLDFEHDISTYGSLPTMNCKALDSTAFSTHTLQTHLLQKCHMVSHWTYKCNFIYGHKKVQPYLSQFSWNLQILLNQISPNWTINMWNMDRNSFTHPHKIWLSLHWFPLLSKSLSEMLWTYPVLNFIQNQIKKSKQDKNVILSLTKWMHFTVPNFINS
jgi:hypothetical protein